jgi:hypothetical protein
MLTYAAGAISLLRCNFYTNLYNYFIIYYVF